MQYFVIQVETGAEARVRTLATRRLRDGRVFWPRRRLAIRRRGKRSVEEAPLFPGYLFYEAEEVSGEALAAFRGVRGFYRFLESNASIRPLAGDDLALVRHFLSFGEIAERSQVRFDANSRIQVISGPLKGLEGRIVKVDKRKGRAKVKLDLYEESFAIDLGFELIEPTMAEKARREGADSEPPSADSPARTSEER